MAVPVIDISDAAMAQIEALLTSRGKPSIGVRVDVKKGGCSGLAYDIAYADAVEDGDEIVKKGGITILVAPKAVMYLLGTKMDYVEEKFKSGFVFINPNERGRCGCGESFHT